MRLSVDSWKQPNSHRPWLSWGTSATLILLEGQHGSTHPVQELTIDSNFFMEVEEDPRRKSVLLDLVLSNQEGLVKDKRAGNSFGYSYYGMVELGIIHGGSKALRTRTLNF